MKITDATVLITGAAKRVGAEIARAFAAAGAKVIVHCNTSRAEAEQLTEELGGEAAGHSVVCCDLSNPENIPALFSELPRDLSILVNNASVFNRQDMEHETLSCAKSGDHQDGTRFVQLLSLQKSACGSDAHRGAPLCPPDARQRPCSGPGVPSARSGTPAYGKDAQNSSARSSGESARSCGRLRHACRELLDHRSDPVCRLRSKSALTAKPESALNLRFSPGHGRKFKLES